MPDHISARPRAQLTSARGGKITKVALAAALGIVERQVHAIFRNGTTSRDYAERIAKLWGGRTEQFLRPPRRRGRRRLHPFRDFISEADKSDVEGDAADYLAVEFALMYGGMKGANVPPDDFETLEALANFVRNAALDIESRDAASILWKRFRVWREYHLYLERVYAIEMEEDVF